MQGKAREIHHLAVHTHPGLIDMACEVEHSLLTAAVAVAVAVTSPTTGVIRAISIVAPARTPIT